MRTSASALNDITHALHAATHIVGCAYRALCCMGQVLFALNRRYLINEKGALAEAAGLCSYPAAMREIGNAERLESLGDAAK